MDALAAPPLTPEQEIRARGVIIELEAPPVWARPDAPAGRAIELDHGLRELGGAISLALGREIDLARRLDPLARLRPERSLLDRLNPFAGVFRSSAPRLPLSARAFTDAFHGLVIAGVTVDEARVALAAQPGIARVTENGLVRALVSDVAPEIGAPEVWAVTRKTGENLDGAGVRIGILDTGVDYTHPDLGGCFGPGCKVYGGRDFINRDADPMDDHGHGTHVAGTAAGNGSVTLAGGGSRAWPGVAPGALIYALKVLNASGNGDHASILAGIEACGDPDGNGDTSDHLDICSMSLGTTGNPDDSLSLAVDRVTTRGVLFAIAAGNNGAPGSIGSPGTARSALTVGASCLPGQIGKDKACRKAVTSFSSKGPVQWTDAAGARQVLQKPDVVAPGHLVCAAQWSDYHNDALCPKGSGERGHIAISGTSMATPVVSGLAALLKQAQPHLAPEQLKAAIIRGARTLGEPGTDQGAGLVQAEAALDLVGRPSGVARFGGVPLVVVNRPRTARQSHSAALTVTNVTDAPLVYRPSFAHVGDGAGWSVRFGVAELRLAPGASAPLPIQVEVDHAAVASPGVLRGRVTLETDAGPARVGLTVQVENRVDVDLPELDFGLLSPEDAEPSAERALELTHLLAGLPTHLRARVECCEINGRPAAAGAITVTPDLPEIELGPAGTPEARARLLFRVAARSAPLLNGRYLGRIYLEGDRQRLQFPFTFYKGYAVKVRTRIDAPPVDVQGYLGETGFAHFQPDPGQTETTVQVPSAGAWTFRASWNAPADPGTGVPHEPGHTGYTVFRHPVPISRQATEIAFDRDEATHELRWHPTGPFPGKRSWIANFSVAVLANDSGSTQLISSGQVPDFQHRFNVIPGNHSIVAVALAAGDQAPPTPGSPPTAGGSDPRWLEYYHWTVPGPLAESRTFANSPREFMARELVSMPADDADGVPVLSPGICASNICTNGGYIQMRLPRGEARPLFVHSSGIADPRAGPRRDFVSLHLNVHRGGWFRDAAMYDTPEYLFLPPAAYPAAPGAATGLGEVLAFHHMDSYETQPLGRGERLTRNLVAQMPGPFLPIGTTGPLRDGTRWNNYADQHVALVPGRGMQVPFFVLPGGLNQWRAQFGDRGRALETTYLVRRGAEAPLTGAYPFNEHRSPQLRIGTALQPHAPGDYHFELSRTARVAGTDVVSRTTTEFKTLSFADNLRLPTDSNPPALDELTLTSNGLWQSTIDPAARVPSVLAFAVDPVPGLTNLRGGRMPDQLSPVSLELRLDRTGAWRPLAHAATPARDLPGSATRSYRAALPAVPGVKVYGLRISATDAAGNSLVSEFEIPAGPTLDPARFTRPALPPR